MSKQKYKVEFIQEITLDSIDDIFAESEDDAIKQAERSLYKGDYEIYTKAYAKIVEDEDEDEE